MDNNSNNKMTPKRIVALIGIILLLAVYLVTFVAAFFAKMDGGRVFRICLMFTVAIPMLTFLFMWMFGRGTGKKVVGDPEWIDKEEVKEMIREAEEEKVLKATPIRNVIFDIGNVLTNYRWHDFLIEQGFDEEMVQRIAKSTVYHPAWNEFDRGILTKEEIMKQFVESDPEIEAEIRKGFETVHNMVTKRENAIPWIQGLKAKGYKVYYLSNFSEIAERECADSIDFIPYMDGGILSYKDKLIKPDRRIYELLLERYNLKAEECVFIDDVMANIDGAAEVGIRGVNYKSYDQVREELKELGVEW